MVCLQSFCLEFLLLFLLSFFSSDMVCLQVFLFLFCSFLVNFTNLSWKEFNIILIILIYWVELYYYLCFFFSFFLIHVFVWFLGWGMGGGALAFMKKTGVWGSILLTIYVLVYYILFFSFPPTLISVSECDVLWTATCAVISLVGCVKSRF